MKQPLIVFDLDGTLIDTAPDLIDTLNIILARESLPAVAYAEARLMIGGGVRRLVELALIADRQEPHKPLIDRMFADFLVHYRAHIADRSRPFPHLLEAMDTLSAQGCRFAVCTNKLEELSLKLLAALGMTDRFAAICGQDTFGVMKPDPAMLLSTIARAGGDPGRSVMIGDSATDIHTAQAAGIPVVAVDFGYTERPVHEFGPDRVISSYAELPRTLAELGRLA